MTERTRFDQVLPGLFDELADARTPDYLVAAIELASSRPQRPAWTYPGRWLPMQITTEALPAARGQLRLISLLALIGVLIAVAMVAYVGSRQTQPVTVPPFGLTGNGVIALATDGDIVVADRPGGDLRALVAGPESDYNPTFSPDGTRLAFERATDLGPVRMGVLMLADADGANVVQLTQEPLETYGTPWSFAPDGRSLMTLARIDGAWRVVVRPVDPAAALAVLDIRLPDTDQLTEHPRFHPTNSEEVLVIAQLVPDGPRGLYVHNLATGEIRTIVEPTDGRYVLNVAWLPDGEHITYSLGPDPYIIAADGSGAQAFNAVRDRVSSFSNDGTRFVADREARDGEAEPSAVIAPISGEREPVVLACGHDCPRNGLPWIWSPDDSMLIGVDPNVTGISGEGPLTYTYLLVDSHTGQVTQLDWRDAGTPAWQRLAP